MQTASEKQDEGVEFNAVTIRSQLEAVKKFLKFASEQSDLIENYYRYDDRGEVFRSPMNIQTGYCGDSRRSDFPSQQCAFFLAKNIYHQLCKDFWGSNNLQIKLKKIKALFDESPFEKETDSRKKFADAIEDGEEKIDVSPIPDQFYPAYLEFGQRLNDIIANFDKIPEDAETWLKELKLIFANHARHLIHEGKFTPEHFQQALCSYNEETKATIAANEDCCIDFDYLYEVSTLFSVYMGRAHSVTVNGKLDFVWEKYSTDELIDKLKVYFATIKHQTVIDIFFEVFKDIYLKEVAFPIAQRRAAKTTQNGEQRWNSLQFWSDEQREHQRSMAPALTAINALDEDADHVPKENFDSINQTN